MGEQLANVVYVVAMTATIVAQGRFRNRVGSGSALAPPTGLRRRGREAVAISVTHSRCRRAHVREENHMANEVCRDEH